jgi:hypothetical protein
MTEKYILQEIYKIANAYVRERMEREVFMDGYVSIETKKMQDILFFFVRDHFLNTREKPKPDLKKNDGTYSDWQVGDS